MEGPPPQKRAKRDNTLENGGNEGDPQLRFSQIFPDFSVASPGGRGFEHFKENSGLFGQLTLSQESDILPVSEFPLSESASLPPTYFPKDILLSTPEQFPDQQSPFPFPQLPLQNQISTGGNQPQYRQTPTQYFDHPEQPTSQIPAPVQAPQQRQPQPQQATESSGKRTAAATLNVGHFHCRSNSSQKWVKQEEVPQPKIVATADKMLLIPITLVSLMPSLPTYKLFCRLIQGKSRVSIGKLQLDQKTELVDCGALPPGVQMCLEIKFVDTTYRQPNLVLAFEAHPCIEPFDEASIIKILTPEIEVISTTSWRNRYSPYPSTTTNPSPSPSPPPPSNTPPSSTPPPPPQQTDSNQPKKETSHLERKRERIHTFVTTEEGRALWESAGWRVLQKVAWHDFLKAVKEYFKINEKMDIDFLRHCIGGNTALNIEQGVDIHNFSSIFVNLKKLGDLTSEGLKMIATKTMFAHKWFCGWSEDGYIQRELLQKDAGSFLIRFSKSDTISYALVVKMKKGGDPADMFSKFLLKNLNEVFSLVSNGRYHGQFPSLEALLEYYYVHPLPHLTLQVCLKPTHIAFGELSY